MVSNKKSRNIFVDFKLSHYLCIPIQEFLAYGLGCFGIIIEKRQIRG